MLSVKRFRTTFWRFFFKAISTILTYFNCWWLVEITFCQIKWFWLGSFLFRWRWLLENFIIRCVGYIPLDILVQTQRPSNLRQWVPLSGRGSDPQQQLRGWTSQCGELISPSYGGVQAKIWLRRESIVSSASGLNYLVLPTASGAEGPRVPKHIPWVRALCWPEQHFLYLKNYSTPPSFVLSSLPFVENWNARKRLRQASRFS